MSILLVGAKGQVGKELQRTLMPLSDRYGELVALGRAELDLSDLDAIASTVQHLQPSLIVNAAAYTAVDKAESEPDLAYRLNAEVPKALAIAAKKCSAPMIHISTDYVFPGDDSSPRVETDATGPLSVYGKTKLAGEEAIRDVLEAHIILRTAWVYGSYGKSNFVKTMLRVGQTRSELNVVNDQIGSPTWASDIANAIALASPQIAEHPGIYHLTNRGRISWHEFAVAIFEEARTLGLSLSVEKVNAIPTSKYPTPAQRPAYSVLSCQKIKDVFGYEPPDWRSSLQQMLKQYLSQNPNTLKPTVKL